MNPDNTTAGILSGALKLSTGTVLVRLGSTGTQFVLILWLSPQDYGHWAAAVSATVLLTALTNLGLVDGYLARRGLDYGRLWRESLYANCVLALIAFAVALVYLSSGQTPVALLVVTLAVNIPLQGLGDVLYVRRLRDSAYRKIILAQGAAALVKLAAGVLVAALTGSAVALGLSNIAFSVVMIALLMPSASRNQEVADVAGVPSFQERFSWTASVLTAKLPPYLGLFVAQFITTAEVLGLYYLSYQAILAVSALIAPPVRRVALNSMTKGASGSRSEVLIGLSHTLASSATVFCAGLAGVLFLLPPIIPANWAPALPAIVIFLALLPGRLVSPLIDAYEQSRNAWWRVTRFHLADGLVVVCAALSAATDDVVVIAAAVTVARLGAILVRVIRVRGVGLAFRVQLVCLLLTSSFLLLASGTFVQYRTMLLILACVLGAIWLVRGLGRIRHR